MSTQVVVFEPWYGVGPVSRYLLKIPNIKKNHTVLKVFFKIVLVIFERSTKALCVLVMRGPKLEVGGNWLPAGRDRLPLYPFKLPRAPFPLTNKKIPFGLGQHHLL